MCSKTDFTQEKSHVHPTTLIPDSSIGTGRGTKTHDFSKKFQTAIDQPPSFSEIYIAIFSENPCLKPCTKVQNLLYKFLHPWTEAYRAWKKLFWDPSHWDKMCFEYQKIKFRWKKMDQNFHICLRSGPRGLTIPPDRKISVIFTTHLLHG